ncbi:hypothetical protein [Niabella hibiscisoli]|uniref:hypothetical protein n=1 Tax=Niabella hibiscisoli TaxID=1825928 RepID=UPI001F0E356C|nr:hypothetical protein [Niabella hibiscisoli]MCH5715440.1 hypothetical protein [Niabella hibiscisoli]
MKKLLLIHFLLVTCIMFAQVPATLFEQSQENKPRFMMISSIGGKKLTMHPVRYP